MLLNVFILFWGFHPVARTLSRWLEELSLATTFKVFSYIYIIFLFYLYHLYLYLYMAFKWTDAIKNWSYRHAEHFSSSPAYRNRVSTRKRLVPPIRQLLLDPHCSTSHKTKFSIYKLWEISLRCTPIILSNLITFHWLSNYLVRLSKRSYYRILKSLHLWKVRKMLLEY
jgi:hypothetical protein